MHPRLLLLIPIAPGDPSKSHVKIHTVRVSYYGQASGLSSWPRLGVRLRPIPPARQHGVSNAERKAAVIHIFGKGDPGAKKERSSDRDDCRSKNAHDTRPRATLTRTLKLEQGEQLA